MTMDRAAAVAGRSALCIPSLDNALIAMTLGGAGHIHVIASRKGVSLDLSADFEVGSVVKLEFLEVLLGGNARLLQVA